jgi:hypothetical protein
MKKQQHLVGMLSNQQSTAAAGISEGDELASLDSGMGAQPNEISARNDYQLPSEPDINAYARAVCERLVKRDESPSVDLQSMVNGFSALVKLLFRLEVQRLNNLK